jgi:hypothetical protein
MYCKVITTIVAWLLLDWEGSDKYCSANKVRSSVVHCRGVKPEDKTTTQSIAALVNTDNTEVVNKQINKSKSRLLIWQDIGMGATLVAVNSSQIQKENKYHSEHKRKQIGYNNNREPQPLYNTSCWIVRWQWRQGMWEVERIMQMILLWRQKDEGVFQLSCFLIVRF